MKAILCSAYGPVNRVDYGEALVPEIKEDEVLVHVNYCGVNYPDVLIVQGKYQFKPDLPFSPGGEVAGQVVKAGAKAGHFRTGDRVLAAMGWGGFAEFAVAKASNTYLLPAGLSEKTAAALLETYATSLYALKDRALLKAGDRLLVLGASGGTGTAAIQLGKLFGAKVVAVASTAEKRAFADENGADYTLAPTDDIKNELKKLGGMDVVFDPVGGPISEEAFRTLKPGGRHLVVGFASGEIPAIPFNLPLLKSASVVGVFWGHFWRNFPEENRKNVRILLKWLAENKIKPNITETYPLADAARALQQLETRQVKGKIVLEVSHRP